MILDLDTLPGGQADALAADVCIVGAGAVGLSMAATLSRSGARVLVLEGGGQRLESASQALQQGESIGHPFANIDVGRYRVLGGTTTFWGGQLYPFDRSVTGERPWLGHAAWPIDPAELDRWFASTYELLGLGDVLPEDDRLWPALGVEVPALGPDIDLVATRWVRTRNFAKLFAPVLRAADGPTVLLHANAVALGLDPARRRVVSVEAKSLGGRRCTVRAGHVVLANGALEIPRLLMHPLADGSAPPWADFPWLGAALTDHLDCHAGDVHVADHRRFHDLFDNVYAGGHKYYPKMRLAPAAQQREGLVDIAAQFLYRTRFSEHLDYLKMFVRSIREGSGGVGIAEVPKHLAAVASTAWPLAVRYFKDRRSFKPRDAQVGLMLYTEQLPTRRSRLLLGPAVDPLGLRRLRVDWQIDGREIATMRYFAIAMRDRLADLGLARITLDPALLAGDPSFATRIHDAIHQMGTTRMGSDTASGVVDADLRVFGTANLHVAGAAVYPSSGFANPTFTALALGQRLAASLGASPR